MNSYRLMTANDKSSFIELMNTYVKEYITIERVYPVFFDEQLSEAYWNYLQVSEEKYITVVAEYDTDMVGFYIGKIHDYDEIEKLYFKGNRRGEGLELYVSPEYRNQHIGEQLMKFLEQQFIKEECQHIVLNNVNITNIGPQKLYHRLGYTPWTMSFYKKVS